MSGLRKAKKYNWKDSNMALFGSETEKEVKKAAAETEPAWKNAGKKPGLQIWRINKFKVEAWPPTDYGQFYTGDSYIILHTYKDPESDKLLYDIHFWIGEHSTQDEYGTAAYKTVELDTLLDDVPVQHREVQGHESVKFKKHFKTIVYNKGGVDSGFKHVEPKEYKPRLFKVSSHGKTVQGKQVKVNKSQITSADCYVLDDGATFYHFRGSAASAKESYSAAQLVQTLKCSRPDAAVETVEEVDGGEALETFYEALERADAGCDDEDDELQQQMDAEQEEKNKRRTSKLCRLSDADGKLTFSVVKEGDISKKDFDSKDVFILDTASHGLFVWNGRRASEKEKANGLTYAHRYLQGTSYPYVSVTVLTEKQDNCDEFRTAIAA